MSIHIDTINALVAQNPWWTPGAIRETTRYQHRRDLFDTLRSRLLDESFRRATLMLGPKQVGKSVLLGQIVSALLEERLPPGNITYFDFDDDRIRGPIPEPVEIAAHLPTGSDPSLPRVLLLDEIHRTSTWSTWLKRVVDEDRRQPRSMFRILATDSAASVLRQGTLESGQGRWVEERIYGLTFTEYLRFLAVGEESEAEVFRRNPGELERYLSKGGFPEHVAAEPSDELRRWIREDIAEKAIRRDILAEGPGREGGERLDVDRLKRLFVYLAQDSGGIFTVTERARELELHRVTVSAWTQLLDDACLVHSLEPFAPSAPGHAPKASRRLRARPRIFASEHGMIPAFALAAQPMSQSAVRARVFEAVVLRHLLQVVRDRKDIRYWRSADDLEIDFVLHIGERLHAVEVTSSAQPDSRKLKRFEQGVATVGAHHATLVHGGTTEERVGTIRLLPLHRFLLQPGGLTQETGA
jgi:predicted AAA+ superfamily ATPase